MKVIVTGNGHSGSWKIRGEQLGSAIGATVDPNIGQLNGHDLAIIVKRPRPETVRRLQEHGTPIVWDVVDAWPQPHGNDWNKAACIDWFLDVAEFVKPVAVVAATRAMARDFNDLGYKTLAVPHHARPSQPFNPIRPSVKCVGYEGGLQYLGNWMRWFEVKCTVHQWRFILNPANLADIDIVVAVRTKGGYAAKNWKSNVKLANAQGTGTPCVMNREAGYMETNGGGVIWADSHEEMESALNQLVSHSNREFASACLLSSAPKLESIAAVYKEWLHAL